MLIGSPNVFPIGMWLFFLELLRPKEDFRNPLREILSLSENKYHPNLAASTIQGRDREHCLLDAANLKGAKETNFLVFWRFACKIGYSGTTRQRMRDSELTRDRVSA